MWIIPNNHPLYSAFAPEYGVSKEELKEHWESLSEPPLSWKEKRLSLKTYWRLWSTVWWFPHQSGRTLKPSLSQAFTEKYTALWEGTHVNHSPWPATGMARETRDTFGRLYEKVSAQQSLFGASSKTSMITSPWDLTRFTAIWSTWVISLRAEYTQRKKLAHHMAGRGFVFSPSDERWPTPTAMIQEESLDTFYARKEKALKKKINGNGIGMNLAHAVKQWPTPMASEYEKAVIANNQNSLSRMVYRGEMRHWASPRASDARDTLLSNETLKKRQERNNGVGLSEQIQRLQAGLPDKDLTSTKTNQRELLNPAWSIRLMGTTLSAIFTVPLATEWWSKRLPKPLRT